MKAIWQSLFSCRLAVRRLNDALDRSLSWAERMGLGAHLVSCGICRRYRRQSRMIRRGLQSLHESLDDPSGAGIPPADRERIRRRLLGLADTGAGSPEE